MEDLSAPDQRDTCIDDEGKQDIEDHSPCHDHQTSEGLLAPELVGLRFTLDRIGVERFVDHASDLAVAPEGKPTYTVGRTTTLACPLEEGEPGVEEEVELLYTCSEEASHRVVPELMDEDEDGEGEEKLNYTNCYIHLYVIV